VGVFVCCMHRCMHCQAVRVGLLHCARARDCATEAAMQRKGTHHLPSAAVCTPPFPYNPLQDTPEAKAAWCRALGAAIDVSRQRSLVLENPNGAAEVARFDAAVDPSLEVEGVVFKRAFAPGKRGKWLRCVLPTPMSCRVVSCRVVHLLPISLPLVSMPARACVFARCTVCAAACVLAALYFCGDSGAALAVVQALRSFHRVRPCRCPLWFTPVPSHHSSFSPTPASSPPPARAPFHRPRRLCRISIERARIEYFDCVELGSVALGPGTSLEACGAPADEAEGLFLFRIVSRDSGAGGSGSGADASGSGDDGSAAAAPSGGDAGSVSVAVLAEADDSQRVVWMSFLRHAIESAVAAAAASAAAAAEAATSLSAASQVVVRGGNDGSGGGSVGSTALAVHVQGATDEGNAIPLWSNFKTRQSKATLQVPWMAACVCACGVFVCVCVCVF
jgi:hypothetical protein